MHTIFRSIQQVHDTHTLTAVILGSKYLAREHSGILITETYCPTDLAQHKPLEIINNKYWLLSYFVFVDYTIAPYFYKGMV